MHGALQIRLFRPFSPPFQAKNVQVAGPLEDPNMVDVVDNHNFHVVHDALPAPGGATLCLVQEAVSGTRVLRRTLRPMPGSPSRGRIQVLTVPIPGALQIAGWLVPCWRR